MSAVWIPSTLAEMDGTLPEGRVDNLSTDLASLSAGLALRELLANKGIANGYAGLDSGGKVPAGQLPQLAHSGLSGLAADDHAQYMLLAGRSGDQTLAGGSAASENLTLKGTGHATPGFVLVPGSLVGLNQATPAAHLHLVCKDASTVGIIARAFSGGTNIQEWRDSGDAILLRINATGTVVMVSGSLSHTPTGSAIFNNAGSPTNLLVNNHSGSDVVLAVRGLSTQTASSHVQLQGISSTSTARPQAAVGAAWATNTDASRKGRLTLWAADSTGTDREGVRVESDGTQALLSFFGGGAAAKPAPSGSRGGNAALASLLTALANLGLITDSTSA